LTPSEHIQVLETTIETVNKRLPVIAGVGFNQSLAVEWQRPLKKQALRILAFLLIIRRRTMKV